MTIHRPLFWYQGLFLQPQHLQLLERSLQTLLVPFQEYLQPYLWGVDGAEIQKAALGTRAFGLMKGTFLFQDGTYAVLPGNALVETRTFDQAWIEGGKPFQVHVGVRKWNEAGENVTVLAKLENLADVTTRFVSRADPEEVQDLHSGGPVGQVKRLHYVLRIFWESERDQLGDYVLLPIAQLERMGEEIRLSEQFAPPSLSVSGSEPLMKLAREVRDQVAARGRQLEEFKTQRGIQTAEFGSRDMVYLLALRSLNRYIPTLSHFLETPSVHPWDVYGALRQLIGELSTFSENVNVMGESDRDRLLPAYDHGSLWKCFAAAQGLVSRLLDEITAGPEYVVRLIYDGTYYASELKPAMFEGRNRFYLAIRTDEDPKAVVPALGVIAKLSSREQLPLLIARALPGIGMEHLPLPPPELPRRARTIYFALDHHGDAWDFVEKGRNMALYWDSAPEDLEAELMVVGRS
ncbi:MAG TPA: type VI secretion system baseplate subunit TssK [Candidatus Methylomirabilis sp.]|nr:type VI secretion system baseplate subunit TssK [Candidatus Methylomirabilis sp.]